MYLYVAPYTSTCELLRKRVANTAGGGGQPSFQFFQFFTSHKADYGSQDRLQAPYTGVFLCLYEQCLRLLVLLFCPPNSMHPVTICFPSGETTADVDKKTKRSAPHELTCGGGLHIFAQRQIHAKKWPQNRLLDF